MQQKVMMNNEEEKRCPLCAEEMDWTDQQFMPCKCGYQVCIWCWHHIIDMAEKDETEGRCPACRTIYEKEKIVAMQANSERTMSKVSNRKSKPQKAKPKTNEVKKDLTNIRVIQRKMAYVIGLPLSLADEDVLQRKEYFGQYGKVTKISLSRTAGGAIQQFINDTSSVYITYSKEEEALQCIQSVHGFVLEGRLLRASFGTAKYCHAWLKNLPCNNPACLYLHSIGDDVDSFGKDEVAAVHTRSRVHQIVGAPHNVIKRSGTVLPPPVDDVHISSSTFRDKSPMRNNILDAAHGSGNSTADMLPCKDKEGPIAVPHKMTKFVNIVERSSSTALDAPEKDGNTPEDGRILDLCSELSSTAVGGDAHMEAPYYVPSLFKFPSSNHVESSADEPLREGSLLYNQGSKDTSGSSHGPSFLHPCNSSLYSEDTGFALLQKKTPNTNGLPVDNNPVNNQDDEASLPSRCLNSISSDLCREMKFQTSAKSNRIYRSSQSFEEIVEHLRRIDDDDDKLHNDEDKSVLDAVESSIVSNILSIDLDSYEDSFHMPSDLSELLDEPDGLGGSSWSSLNSDQSGYSFAKQDGFASQVATSILPEYGDNKEHYLYKTQYPVISRAQSLAPPGFSIPSRDPPPGFSNFNRTVSLPRRSSGSRLPNASPFSTSLLQPSLVKHGGSFDGADFFNPNQANNNFEARPTSTPGLNTFEDEYGFWPMMPKPTPPHQNPKFSQMFAPQAPFSQQEMSFSGHHKVNSMSGPDNSYSLSSSRPGDEHQNCNSSFFTQMPHQSYGNSNGYLQSICDIQHKGEVGLAEVQRNERLGVNHFAGDVMFSPGDVYTRVFGL